MGTQRITVGNISNWNLLCLVFLFTNEIGLTRASVTPPQSYSACSTEPPSISGGSVALVRGHYYFRTGSTNFDAGTRSSICPSGTTLMWLQTEDDLAVFEHFTDNNNNGLCTSRLNFSNLYHI